MSSFIRLKKTFMPSLVAGVLLFAGIGFVSAATDAVSAAITVSGNMKVVGRTTLGMGGLKLAGQIVTGAGKNDGTTEWSGAAVVVFPSAKAQSFNLGACSKRPERIVTLIVKDSGDFVRTVNATSDEGIIPAGGGLKAPLTMRNFTNGDIRSATLYCDGSDWMVTGQELRTAGPVISSPSVAFKMVSLGSTTVLNDTLDAELFRFSASSTAELTVKAMGLRVSIAGPGKISDIDAVMLVDADTGEKLTAPFNLTGDANTSVDFHLIGPWKIKAGRIMNIKVIADIADILTPGTTIRVTLGNVHPAGGLIEPGQIVTASGADIPLSQISPQSPIDGAVITIAQRLLRQLTTGYVGPLSHGPVGTGTNDTELFRFISRSTVNLEVNRTEFKVEVIKPEACGFLKDVKIVDTGTGAIVAGPVDLSNTGGIATLCDTTTANDLVQFTKSWTLSADVPRTFKLTADIGSQFPPSGNVRVILGDGGDLYDPDAVKDTDDGTFLSVASNGFIPSGEIQGNYQTVLTIAPGSLTVTRAPDDAETEAGFILGGTLNAVLAKYKFSAVNEELKLVDATLYVDGESSDVMGRVSLYDGDTLVGGPSPVTSPGNIFFSGMNVIIPKDGSKVLTVRAEVHPVGSEFVGFTGMKLTSFLNNFPDQFGPSGTTFLVTGTSPASTTRITSTGTADVAGNSKLLRKSKPIVTPVALPAANLANGTAVANRFSITADAAGAIAFQDLLLTVTTTGGVLASCSGTESGLRHVGDATDTPGICAGAGPGTVTIHFDSEQVIPAGATRTYDVRLTVVGVTSGSSLGTSIGVTGFHWSDLSSADRHQIHDFTNESSTDWIFGGIYIKNLPTAVQTLSS